MDNQETPKWKIYLFMLFMLLTGSINTIANKLQQNTNPLGISYSHHQKFITFCMFHGEVVCLIIYYFIHGRKKEEKKLKQDDSNYIEIKTIKKTPQPKFYYFLFPAFFDFLASTSTSISLTYLAPSIYQMFRGAIIIFTCLGSIIFLKSKYYRHHVLGIIIVIIGLLIVGLNAIFNNTGNSSEHPLAGIILVVTGQIFAASMFITEEKLLKKFNCHPLKVVGSEGCWGVCIYYIVLFIFYQLRCENWPKNLRDGICIENLEGELRFEDAPFAILQLLCDYQLDCILLLYISSIAVFNLSGLLVTKYASSTSRTVVDTLRTILVWIFFLTMPLSIKETFSWLQLFGFIVLIIGSVIYNEIVEIHYAGFDQYTKRAIKEREEKNSTGN
jgi:drug/metabolite transporter (DMT)-like permease